MENVKLISVTDISSYTFCRRGLYLKLVLGFREPPKPVMVLGSIRHKVYDEANKKEEYLVSQVTSDMKRQEILQMFANTYNAVLNKSIYNYSSQIEALNLDKNAVAEQLKPLVSEQSQARADEILSFSSKTNLFGKELWSKLTPKIISELGVRSEKLRLKGIIDRIEIHGDEYVPVEIKTGRVPSEGVWPDHRLQVASYMMLLNDQLKVNVKEGLVKYVKTNQTRQIVMNPFMEYEVSEAVNNVFSLMEQKDVPNFCGKSYCSICALGEDYGKHLIKKQVYS
jgi:CRISPR-associated protein Cas4